MDHPIPSLGQSPASLFTRLRTAAKQWWPVWAGFICLFVPTLDDLLRGPWGTEAQGHGPIILAIAVWLIWRRWPVVVKTAVLEGAHFSACVLLASGLVLYALGRSQHILMFEIGAIPVLLASLIWVTFGAASLRATWFAFFFMLFMIPLPGEVVATLTLPMKLAVSFATEQLLFALGYPISRAGVILQIGQYQLLVADACAGLQTLLTLEALGLLYLNIKPHISAVRNLLLALLIVPISFTANVIRVMVLTLITYHAGAAAAQGFLHGFAGIVLFLTALTLILAADAALQWQVRRVARSGGAGTHRADHTPGAPGQAKAP